MKHQAHIPTKTAGLLAAAVLMAVGTVAFAQQESQSTPGQSSSASQQSQQSQQGQTFEGRLVPLFQALKQHSMSSGGSSSLQGSTPGTSSSTPGASTPGASTPGASTPGASSAQGSASASSSAWSSLTTSQPLALMVDSSSSSGSSSQGSSSTPGASSSTPGASASTSSSSSSQGQLYILVFDPNDQQAQTAYQMAQSYARSSTASSTSTPGISDRQPVREREGSSSMGEKVKVTGRLLQHEGIKAIAVQKVERSSSSQGSSSPGGSSGSSPGSSGTPQRSR